MDARRHQTSHNTNTEKAGILACYGGVPGRGYVYMTNRGAGRPKVVTEDVEVHFAEIESGQVDDQFNLWQSEGAPACDGVADCGHLGVYVYPESLRTERMSAMVQALNTCTGL